MAVVPVRTDFLLSMENKLQQQSAIDGWNETEGTKWLSANN